MATEEEKGDIMVGPSVIQTIHTLVTGGIRYLDFPTNKSQATRDIGRE